MSSHEQKVSIIVVAVVIAFNLYPFIAAVKISWVDTMHVERKVGITRGEERK